ncbi:MAG: hypothetical protein ACE5HI_14700, partial [bacterium]
YLAYFISRGIPKPVTRAGNQGLHILPPAEAPKDQFNKSSLWWRFHRLTEEIGKKPEKRYQEVRTLLDPVERMFQLHVENLFSNPASIEQNQLDNLMHDQVAKTLEVLEKIEQSWNII